MKRIFIGLFAIFTVSSIDWAGAEPYYPQEPNAAAIIREKCKQDFPSDFQMRAYCEKNQWDGLSQLYGRGKESEGSGEK